MRRRLFITISLMLLFVMLAYVYEKPEQALPAFSVDAVTEDEIKNELIVAVFVNDITSHIHDYYSEFYSGPIAVYNYEIDIVEINKSNGLIHIKFGVTPQIGAHNPLGYDELSYSIDSSGNGKFTQYEHMKDYPIPKRFQGYIIKPMDR